MIRLPLFATTAVAAAALATFALAEPAPALAATASVAATLPAKPAAPVTPIQHVIVVVGENHTFDNLFGTYKPRKGQKIANLLSKGIVNADGTPGPNFALARQRVGVDTGLYQATTK